MKRREFLRLSLGTAAVAALSSRARAEAGVKDIRIGYQKNGVLVIARQQSALEKHFNPQGVDVKWVEFSSGPLMLEAMNVGSIDYGAVGDSPGRRRGDCLRSGSADHEWPGHLGAAE